MILLLALAAAAAPGSTPDAPLPDTCPAIMAEISRLTAQMSASAAAITKATNSYNPTATVVAGAAAREASGLAGALLPGAGSVLAGAAMAADAATAAQADAYSEALEAQSDRMLKTSERLVELETARTERCR